MRPKLPMKLAVLALSFGWLACAAQAPPPYAPPARVAPPGSSAAPGSNDLAVTESDRRINEAIRTSFETSPEIDSGGRGVRISTYDGNVTLRGVVRTARERDAIGAAAEGVSGAKHVDNLVSVAP